MEIELMQILLSSNLPGYIVVVLGLVAYLYKGFKEQRETLKTFDKTLKEISERVVLINSTQEKIKSELQDDVKGLKRQVEKFSNSLMHLEKDVTFNIKTLDVRIERLENYVYPSLSKPINIENINKNSSEKV